MWPVQVQSQQLIVTICLKIQNANSGWQCTPGSAGISNLLLCCLTLVATSPPAA